MSAVAGVFRAEGPRPDRPLIERLIRRLTHRGGDCTDIWLHDNIALARGLRCPVSVPGTADGPLIERAGPMAITADARLDNRGELLATLGWTSRSRGVSTAQVIMGAYEKWGVQCPAHLIGDFAFALWDGRNRRLLCARDHFGVIPFYYTHAGGSFGFASEIKALLTLSWCDRTYNLDRIADYLMQMSEDAEATFYKGVSRLPPAHTLTVDSNGRAHLVRYWQLEADNGACHGVPPQDYGEAFKALFLQAVSCRIPNGSPVGSMLSGGLDSSALTCAAEPLLRASGGGPLRTFSLVFDEVPESDERPYIEAVIEARPGLDSHFVRGDRLHPLEDLDRMLWHVDEPFFAPNLYLYWAVYRAAHAVGVCSILDGLVGDSVVGHGSRYVTELAATGRWVQVVRELRMIANTLRGSQRRNYRYLMRDFVLDPLLFEPAQRAWAGVSRPDLPNYPQSRFISTDFARRIAWIDRARRFKWDTPRTATTVREEQLRELNSNAFPTALETANKAAAAFAITPAFPFTDRRLMEFCLDVPATEKYRDGWTRVYMRNGLKDVLPKKIASRYGKTYLAHNFSRGLFVVAKEEMRQFVMDRLPIAAEYVDVKAVQVAFEEAIHNPKHPGRARPDGLIVPIWSAVVLTRWLELQREGGDAPQL